MAISESDLRSRLELIASIKEGQTLSPSTLTILDHNSWACGLGRRYRGEDRYTTLAFIRELLMTARTYPQLHLVVEEALRGIHQLGRTYSHDAKMTQFVAQLIVETEEFYATNLTPGTAACVHRAVKEWIVAHPSMLAKVATKTISSPAS